MVYECIKDGFGKLIILLLSQILICDCVLTNCGFERDSKVELVIFGLKIFGGIGGTFLKFYELRIDIFTGKALV